MFIFSKNGNSFFLSFSPRDFLMNQSFEKETTKLIWFHHHWKRSSQKIHSISPQRSDLPMRLMLLHNNQNRLPQKPHSSTHSKAQYPCYKCAYKATHQDNLKTHKKSKHQGKEIENEPWFTFCTNFVLKQTEVWDCVIFWRVYMYSSLFPLSFLVI